MGPASALQRHYIALQDNLSSLKGEEGKIRREWAGSINIERELLMKLQYYRQLLAQRGEDVTKID